MLVPPGAFNAVYCWSAARQQTWACIVSFGHRPIVPASTLSAQQGTRRHTQIPRFQRKALCIAGLEVQYILWRVIIYCCPTLDSVYTIIPPEDALLSPADGRTFASHPVPQCAGFDWPTTQRVVPIRARRCCPRDDGERARARDRVSCREQPVGLRITTGTAAEQWIPPPLRYSSLLLLTSFNA